MAHEAAVSWRGHQSGHERATRSIWCSPNPPEHGEAQMVSSKLAHERLGQKNCGTASQTQVELLMPPFREASGAAYCLHRIETHVASPLPPTFC